MWPWFCIVLLLFSSLDARVHTGKTFLMPQPVRVPADHIMHNYSNRLIANKLDGWHPPKTTRGYVLPKRKMFRYSISKSGPFLGGCLQATSFFRRDTGRSGIGRYFGRAGSNVISIGTNKTDFQAVNLVYTDKPGDIKLKGKLALRPYRKMRGVSFNYLQRLKIISKRLFLNVRVPFVHITRRMNAQVYDETKVTIDGKEVGILDYFSGNLSQREHPFKQEPLTHAKISSCGVQRKEGLGDAEVICKYQFGGSNYYVASFAGVVCPTSNKPISAFLYEPVFGHGRQWGICAGADAMARLYEAGHIRINVTYGFCMRHFFQNTQKRTISFRSYDLDSDRAWSHYYGPLGEAGKRGVFPGANVLTRDVRVQQGLLFDFVMNYNVFYKHFLCSIGYNFFSRGAESAKVKEWPEHTYAIPNPLNYKTSDPFVIVETPSASSHNRGGPIQKEMLDTSVCETPASVSHKVYGMIAAYWDSLRMPVTVGIGGAYECAQDNATPKGFEAYVKVGLAF